MKYFLLLSLLVLSVSASAQLNVKRNTPAPEINITEWLANEPSEKLIKGQSIVLEFWATWCKPCLAAVPHLNDLQEKFKADDLLFLSMTYESPALALPVIERIGFQTPVVADQTRKTQARFGNGKQMPVYPFTVLIDDQNIVRWHGDPEDLTEELLAQFMAKDFPLATGPENYVPLDPSDYLFEPMDRRTAAQLFEADSVGSFVRVWPLEGIPTFTGSGFFIGTLSFGFFDDCSLEQLYQSFFPEKKVIVPDQLADQAYTLAFVDREPDADTKARIEASIIDQLGLVAEITQEANMHFDLKVKSTKQLAATKLEGRPGVNFRDLRQVKIIRQTLQGLVSVLIKHTDHRWQYKGNDQKKYSLTLDFSSTKSLLEGLQKHGLKVTGKEGEIEVVRLKLAE
ncbi:MAG: TlpA disulfide reductase family protein [Bacteroidota bacterium]